MSRGLGRVRAAAAAAVAVGLAAPASALAHAQLESTSPAREATVATEPARVVLRFDETVGGTQGAVRVFDARGARVDDGDAFHPAGRGESIGVGLRPGLANGTYTATYRVVSADTHIVTGGFSFSIGGPGAAGATVGDLLAGQRTGGVTSTAFVLARAVQYSAIAVAGGVVAFLLAVWLAALRVVAGGSGAWQDASSAFLGRARLLVVLAAGAGLLSAVAGLLLQGAEGAGVTFWAAVDPGVVRGVLGTRFGAVWTAAAAAWLLAGAGAAVVLAPRSARAPILRSVALGADGAALAPAARLPLGLLAVPLVLLLALPALAGHSSVQSPVWLLLPANIAHVSAMTVWLGGLAALLAAVPAATRRLPAEDRARLLAALLARFSPLALGCVVVLVATGTIQALVEIGALGQLTSTAFGRVVLIKIALVLVLIALGAVNRQRTVPALRRIAAAGGSPGAAGLVLRRTLRTEVAVIAAVLVVTGVLAGSAPARDATSGPVQVTTTLGPAQLSFDVDPARPGANEMHAYLLDPRTGAQYAAAKALTVTASLPAKGIGPLPLTAHLTGPGHYTIAGAVLPSAGTWTITLTARVSDFDEYVRKVQVPIR